MHRVQLSRPRGQLVGQLLARHIESSAGRKMCTRWLDLQVNEKGQVEERHIVKVHHFSAAFIERTSSAGSLH